MNDFKWVASWWLFVIALFLTTTVILGAYHFLSKPAQVIDRVTDPDHIIASYEEFQEIYNTTQSICTKIAVLGKVEETSGGFSKQERVVALEQQLSRWVGEYNAKSKMISRNLWKSPDLPYQLKFEEVCN